MLYNDNGLDQLKNKTLKTDSKEIFFPNLQNQIGELANNLEKISQGRIKDKEALEELQRENNTLYDNITLAIKSENRKKQPNKAFQLQKIEKTANELYKKMRYLNTAHSQQDKNNNNHIPHDEESHAFLQSQLEDEKLDLHEETLHDREIRIKNVTKGIHEVHQLYSEVAEIGAVQTQKIEHISDNIEKTGLKIMSAKKELLKAKDNQTANRNKYCKILCCILILFCVLIFLFYKSNF